MSGTASTSVVGVGGAELGYGGNGAPFTAVQWQELEQQAMIYKYLVAGVPVPPDLVMAIRHSFQALPAGFFHRPSLGYSYYGKKFDPEPGRCRRTDGKKWRCSKEAHSDSKYCERHMHRGRNRSRKHVESQSTSQSLPTAIPHIFTGCSTNSRNLHGSSGSGSFQRTPLYTVDDSEGSSFGRNATKLHMEPISYGIDEKKCRYKQGLTPGADEHTFSREASESVGNVGSSAASSTKHPMPAQVSLSSPFEQDSDFQIMGNPSAQQHMPYAFQPIDEQKQRCFYVRDVGLPGPVKQEQHPMHLFFSEWPTTKESWSNLDDDGSNQNVLSSTQLSISIPKASSDFPSRSAYTTNEA